MGKSDFVITVVAVIALGIVVFYIVRWYEGRASECAKAGFYEEQCAFIRGEGR